MLHIKYLNDEMKNIYSLPERWMVTTVGKTKFNHLRSKNCRYI